VIVTVPMLHLIAGRREVNRDSHEAPGTDWLDAGAVDELRDIRGTVVVVASHERIALFRYGDCVSALSNVCAHQNGPLGEGRIIDGCVTCPWHGFHYRPQDGCAPPPPFTEKLATYAVKIEGGRVLINTDPLPPGTFVEPARIEPREVAHV
jgi:nitrite reductase/ring-hydroxylating ferredoxin subunit